MAITIATRGSKMDRGIALRPLPGPIGAEVANFDVRELDAGIFQQIQEAMLHHVLLVFRSQTLTPEDIVRIICFFGTPVASSSLHQRQLKERAAHEIYRLPAEITVVSNVREQGQAVGALGDAEVSWHSDFSFKERPTATRMLYAKEVPPPSAGGTTSFVNCYAAFDELSESLKQEVSGKTIKQDNTFDTTMKLRPGADPSTDIRNTAGPSHPIISTHPETGCNSLFLGRRQRAYVNDLPLASSETLLDTLWDHCTQERFQYAHTWSVGDVVVWDNRCTLHKRDAFDLSMRRLLYAAQVEGHSPYEAPDALVRPPHTRGRIHA